MAGEAESLRDHNGNGEKEPGRYPQALAEPCGKIQILKTTGGGLAAGRVKICPPADRCRQFGTFGIR